MNKPNPIEQRVEQCFNEIKNESIDDQALDNMQKRIKIAVDNQANVIANQNLKKANSDTKTTTWYADLFNGFKHKVVYASSSAFVVGLVSVFIVMSGNTQTAFAKAQQQLLTIDNMFYQSTMFAQQKAIMQLNVWYKQSGLLRVETQPLTPNSENNKSINLIDITEGKGLMLFPAAKLSVPFQFNPKHSTDPKQNPLHWFDIIKDYKGEVTTLEKRMVDGKWLNGFLIKEAGLSITLWSSDTNYLPVEFSIYDGTAPQSSNFHMQGKLSVNQPLADSLFSMTIPEGYRLGKED